MKKLWILILLCNLAFGVEKIRIYEDRNAVLIHQTSDYQEIASILNSIGIRFEKWQANKTLLENFKQEDIMEAYREDIDRLVRENGYKAIDVVKMLPHSPKKEELRKKFLNEHVHTEDEVRFFVEGSGLFYLHVNSKVYIVLCEQGDLISIPPLYTHWFDMGDKPFFTAIRFFNDPSGWIANFTDSGISQYFPKYDH